MINLNDDHNERIRIIIPCYAMLCIQCVQFLSLPGMMILGGPTRQPRTSSSPTAAPWLPSELIRHRGWWNFQIVLGMGMVAKFSFSDACQLWKVEVVLLWLGVAVPKAASNCIPLVEPPRLPYIAWKGSGWSCGMSHMSTPLDCLCRCRMICEHVRCHCCELSHGLFGFWCSKIVGLYWLYLLFFAHPHECEIVIKTWWHICWENDDNLVDLRVALSNPPAEAAWGRDAPGAAM